MVNISTIAKVPIILVGFLGENGRQVSTDITKKYTFAARLNWKSRLNGAQLKNVYLVVRTLFYFFLYSLTGNDV